MTIRNFTDDLDSDIDLDDDIEFDESYHETKLDRAKDVLKEGLSDVQRRFAGTSLISSLKALIPIAVIGTIGAIAYSRREKSIPNVSRRGRKSHQRKHAASKSPAHRPHA